jgi:hypothetical protein
MAKKKWPPKQKQPGPFPEPYLKKPLPYWTIPQRAGDTPLVQKFKQNRFMASPIVPPPVLHALIVVAARRIEQLNPYAARQFQVDIAHLILNLSELFGLRSAADLIGPGGPANVAKTKEDYEQFLDDFFAEIEVAKVATDKRHELEVPSVMRRLIRVHYRRMVEEIRAAQAALPRGASYEDRCAAIQPALRKMLDAAGPAGQRVELSEQLMEAAVQMSPHQAALIFATATFRKFPVASILKTPTLEAESKTRFRFIDSAVRPPRT